MPSRQFLDRQTRHIDLLLAELSQLATADVVNLNNTKQFDMLLRHLELTAAAPHFCSVPSENVLHILLTLAARCPAANWSHDLLASFAGDTAEYMRQVNLDYDASLHKASLQQRSAAVLERYVAVLRSGTRTPLVGALRRNVHSVLRCFHSADVALFFRRATRPVLGRRSKRAVLYASDQHTPADTEELGAEGLSPGTTGALAWGSGAVEIISDSEDSDALVECAALPPAPRAAVLFSDLGLHTSGMGETAPLFRLMPHLLAMGTPEPEPEELRSKRARVLAPAWKRLQAFDDHVVLCKLLAAPGYDIWSLLRWTCWCANNSSEYQKFLFNSGLTHVHHIYRASASFLGLFFAFCHAELLASAEASAEGGAEGGAPSTAIACLLSKLGPRGAWHESATQHVFSGLGSPAYDKPYPCYHRELALTRSDATVLTARCKTTCRSDDNMHSMGLRVRILLLLFDFEHAVGGQGSGSLMHHVTRALCAVPLVYLRSFFTVLQRELAAGVAAGRLALDAEIGIACLGEITGTRVPVTTCHGPAFAVQMADVLLSGAIFRSVVHDVTFGCVEDFDTQWRKVVFVAEWLFSRALEDAPMPKDAPMPEDAPIPEKAGRQCEHASIVEKARLADQLAGQAHAEYLESRYEDSDLIPETLFTLTLAEIERWLPLGRCSFGDLAAFKLGVPMQTDSAGTLNDVAASTVIHVSGW